MKRIYLCGAHSTGKTTLGKQIAQRKGYRFIPEAARRIIEKHNINFADFATNAEAADDFQRELAHEHRTEHRLQIVGSLDQDISGVVFDRGPDNLVYASLYSTIAASQFIVSQDDISFLQHEDAHVFLIDPQEKLISDDGVRASLNMIDLWKITAGIQCLLEWNAIHYVRIQTPDLIERLKIVEGAVR
jgi:nicotinamide riboside kinase